MNLSVLIGTCDAYQELWKTFQECFNKYWKLDTKNIFVTDTKEVPQYTDSKFYTFSSEGPWGSRMIKALGSVDTDYVFFILEDYFLHYTYTEEQIKNYLDFCSKYNISRLQIAPSGHQLYSNDIKEGFNKFNPMSQYQISLQPSIWSKDFILKTLKPDYSPWDFEIKGSSSLVGQSNEIYIDKSIPSVYFNAVRRGMKKSKGWDEFFEKEKVTEPNI